MPYFVFVILRRHHFRQRAFMQKHFFPVTFTNTQGKFRFIMGFGESERMVFAITIKIKSIISKKFYIFNKSGSKSF